MFCYCFGDICEAEDAYAIPPTLPDGRLSDICRRSCTTNLMVRAINFAWLVLMFHLKILLKIVLVKTVIAHGPAIANEDWFEISSCLDAIQLIM